jgi:hypothetical protein
MAPIAVPSSLGDAIGIGATVESTKLNAETEAARRAPLDTMSQQSSLTQSAHSVRQVLTAYTVMLISVRISTVKEYRGPSKASRV